MQSLQLLVNQIQIQERLTESYGAADPYLAFSEFIAAIKNSPTASFIVFVILFFHTPSKPKHKGGQQ